MIILSLFDKGSPLRTNYYNEIAENVHSGHLQPGNRDNAPTLNFPGVFYVSMHACRFVNCQVDSGATAIYLACQEGHLDVARHLAEEAVASLKLRTYDGMTCVHAAAQMGHLHLLRWLVGSFIVTFL